MKKYICKTSIPGKYEVGEIYKLNEEDRIVKSLVGLGYLEDYKPQNNKKIKGETK